MRHKFKTLFLMAIIGIGLMLWPLHTRAVTGVVYISPSSSSVQNGNNVTVALRINPGTTVDGVQATINFDTSVLQELSVDTSSSDFPVQLQKTVSGGTIIIAMGNLSGGVSSDALIANMSFKALASTGSTSLQISNANATYSGSYTSPSSADGTVSFTAAPSSGGSSSGGSSSGGSSSSSSKKTTTAPAPAASTPTPSTTTTVAPKVIATATLAKLQYSKATIKVITNVATQVSLQYGTDQHKLNQSTPFTALSTTNTVSLDSSQLIPGTTYYYQVVTKDAAGTTTTSETKNFKTKGFTLKVTVLDNNYHPIAGKVVTLHSTPISAKTDNHGVAVFNDTAPGAHEIVYTVSKTKTYQQSVYVQNNLSTKGSDQTAAPQTAAVIMAGLAQPSKNGLQLILTVLAVLIVLASAVLLVVATPLRSIIGNKVSAFKHNIPPLSHPPVITPTR